jgi:hypothetical protein
LQDFQNFVDESESRLYFVDLLPSTVERNMAIQRVLWQSARRYREYLRLQELFAALLSLPVTPFPRNSLMINRARRFRRLLCEDLEHRHLLATYSVINTDDIGAGSLRDAIEQANLAVGADRIEFAISGSGLHTIKPQSPLPSITDTLVIDGFSQSGASPNSLTDGRNNAQLMIELDGSEAGSVASGLDIFGSAASQSVVRGLVINRFFAQAGVAITAAEGVQIEGNFIGIDAAGTSALSNSWGIYIAGGISSILVGSDGVGSDNASERNVISGNSIAGIHLEGALYVDNSTRLHIAGNTIGLDALATYALPNQRGMVLHNEGNLVIGFAGEGNPLAQRNILSGNSFEGIVAPGNTRITIAGNYIGTDYAGQTAVGNGLGVSLNFGAHHNVIGANGDGIGDESEGNLISGNGEGVLIQGGANDNSVAGNIFGMNAEGSVPLGFGGNASIYLQGAGANNRIGTNSDGVSDALERNLVAGAGNSNIRIDGGGGNVIAGNWIAISADGENAVEPWRPAFYILDSASNRIGTDGDGVRDEVERNVIGANVGLLGTGSRNNVVAGNYIGINAAGNAALIGGGTTGIMIVAGATNNRIGTNGDGTADAAERNVISGLFAGIVIDSASNEVYGNYIGTDASGSNPIPNEVGVLLDGNAIGNVIGGEGSLGNRIAYNIESGVEVRDFAAIGNVGNSISGNSIYSNGLLGIDLEYDGTVEDNDALDADVGPNGLQNYPVLVSAGLSGSSLVVAGAINSTPNTTIRIEFFSSQALDASEFGEGEVYLGFVNVTTDGNGDASFNAAVAAAAVGQFITSTATSSSGDTSEFSTGVEVVSGNAAPTVGVAAPTTGVRGQSLTFVFGAEDSAADEAAGFVYTINWGDGSPIQTVSATANNGDGVSLQHVFIENGNYAVTVTAADQQGAVSAVASTSVNVVAAALLPDDCCPGGMMLVVGGTTGNDDIKVDLVGGAHDWRVKFNGVTIGIFSPADRLVVHGYAGNDVIEVAGGFQASAWLYGGEGDDHLKGGAGDDSILGGGGADLIIGGQGRDLLIGGLGADRVVGNADDDILISGVTDYDANTAALCAIMDEWTSSECYVVRLIHLTFETGGLNGEYFLRSEGSYATVHDDNAADLLTGSAGQDWFFANLSTHGNDDATKKDKIADLTWGDFANDLDFILG